jgi:hypothetical protein
MARRAVACFNAQSYPAALRYLLVYGVQTTPNYLRDCIGANVSLGYGRPKASIGEIRNAANEETLKAWDIIIHWDSDDYSHPNRIAEQVALLQSSGADCVGYRQMLFWDQRPGRFCEAWLYSNPDPRYCLGTSLCYWRSAWERKPFESTSQGEDERFTTGLNCVSVTSLFDVHNDPLLEVLPSAEADKTPRMVARIHGGNTSNAYDPAHMARAKEWRRVPEWDKHCVEVMA